MKILSSATFLAIALLTVRTVSGAPEAGAVKTVVITANDNMKYSVTRIEAEPGQKICVQLKNEGTLPKEVMAHNWILLKLGQDPNVYAAKSVSARDQNYQPKGLADQVIASIPLVGARQMAEVTFEAPTGPGKYPFLCSFPAHCQSGMRGELVVK